MAASGADASVLFEQILAEGRRRAERIREEARNEGEAILTKAEAEAESSRRRALDTARAEAARRRERVLAGVPIEVARIRAARVEALLESLRERARRELSARRGFDYREAIISLAAEALRRMAGDNFVLSLAVGYEADLGKGLAEEVLRRAERADVTITVADDPSITGGGLVLRDLEGRQAWDDRLTVRLDRLWPALRLQVATRTGLLDAEGRTPSRAHESAASAVRWSLPRGWRRPGCTRWCEWESWASPERWSGSSARPPPCKCTRTPPC
jgi:vacuolar-type H+-ATPase subunit E/Vma4